MMKYHIILGVFLSSQVILAAPIAAQDGVDVSSVETTSDGYNLNTLAVGRPWCDDPAIRGTCASSSDHGAYCDQNGNYFCKHMDQCKGCYCKLI
ncbi:hypothetical protein QBC47DRAFT_402074 [Echria macrotheca]|uniref:Uncharacterized protein n=1 Tax=Echria macrotheca TaxID=438768 RepID=A0AAJ0BCT9_9PEZI|nr:hypothetical protein QBC47DRAFT_402074 [Echria macrotheca]